MLSQMILGEISVEILLPPTKKIHVTLKICICYSKIVMRVEDLYMLLQNCDALRRHPG